MNFGGAIRLNKTGLILIFCAFLVLFVYIFTNKTTQNNVPPSLKINLKHLLQVAVKAAENGGLEVVSNKDNLKVKIKGLTKEGLEDSVTNADALSHCAIRATLKQAFPALNVISEELVECDNNQKIDYSDIVVEKSLKDEWVDTRDITVWIDPLDATHEYQEKLYKYVTTMVCVAIKGRSIIGVIHKPFSPAQTYWAWVNQAKSNNLNYQEKTSDKLKITISMSHSGQIKSVLDKNIKNYELIPAAGAGFKSLEVATGNVDAYLHITAIKKWDICAGNAIINAVGGKMTTKFDQLIDYTDEKNVINENGLVATVKNHDQFIGKL